MFINAKQQVVLNSLTFDIRDVVKYGNDGRAFAGKVRSAIHQMVTWAGMDRDSAEHLVKDFANFTRKNAAIAN